MPTPDVAERIHHVLVIRESGWHEHRLLAVDNQRVNLHVLSPDCAEVIRHGCFRDWLIEHPADRSRYLDAKVEAAAGVRATGENVMAYNQRKLWSASRLR